tara:strand:+ start:431 stop:652 length:222 start_codon:yes stop_codon:yes gene_type:complete
MNQVRSDQQLRLTVGQAAHCMRIPDFFEKILTHDFAGRQVSTGYQWRTKKPLFEHKSLKIAGIKAKYLIFIKY